MGWVAIFSGREPARVWPRVRASGRLRKLGPNLTFSAVGDGGLLDLHKEFDVGLGTLHSL